MSQVAEFPSELQTPLRPRPTPDTHTFMFILLAGALISSLIVQYPGLEYCPNDASRWATVYQLVEHGTYELTPDHGALWPSADRSVDLTTATPEAREKLYRVGDKYYEQVWYMPVFPTIDMVRLNGKYYSSKPPLLPTILAGVALAIEKITRVDFRTNPWFIMRTTLILVQVVPVLVLVALVGRHARRVSGAPWVGGFCVAAAALGTYLTPYCVTLNNHVIGACSAMVAVYALMRIWYDERTEWYWFALAGFFAAFTATNELPAAPFAAAAMLLVLLKNWRKTLLAAAVPAMLPIIASFVTNYLATGSWRPVYSRFGETGGPYDYPGSYWRNPSGVDALHEPSGIYLTNILIGHHGLFLLTPVFLISLIGALRNLAGRDENRPLLAAAVVAVTGYLACFYTFYTHESRNYGGTDQGARWMFWLIPLWLLFLPSGAAWMGRSRLGRGVCCLLLAVSIFSAGFALRQPWSASWAHILFREFKWINY